MRAIILAAGYATRLYPLTLDRPKALLEIADRPMLDYIFAEIETIDSIDEVYIVSNHKFVSHFTEWVETRKTSKKIKVLDDGTTSDETKLGAIGDIHYVIENEKINDDIMVLAGDNLFTFSLLDFYNYYKSINKDCICVQPLNNINELKRMGIALLDERNKVIDLEEKPQEPKSNIAVYATYIYKKETLPLFETYISSGNKPDAPGYFPSWLYKRQDVYAYVFEGECYDIGTHDSYSEVNELFRRRKNC
jgi:glucose-1-phosphate thymidylyltransferase